VTTTVPDDMIVGLFGIAMNTGISPPTGMTERFQVMSTGGASNTRTTSEGSDATQAAVGPTGNKVATASQPADWVAQLVALKPRVARSTSTTVSCTPATVALAQATTCTATVVDNDSGTQTRPSGTVTFSLVADPDGDAGAFTPP